MKYNTEIIKILKKDLAYYDKESDHCLEILENVPDLDEDQIQDYRHDMIRSDAVASYIRDLLFEIE